MIKKLFLLMCLGFNFLHAAESYGDRYQLTANDKELYLLEKDTGKIWVAQRWEARDIRMMYPNGWEALQLKPPFSNK